MPILLNLNLPQVAVLVTQKIRIHNALIDLVRAGTYYSITNDPVTGHAAIGVLVTPSSSFANEVNSRFAPDTRYRRSDKSDRQSWLWSVLLKFDLEVSSAESEGEWTDSPPTLPLDNNFRGVKFDLVSADYKHPIKQQGHNGTVIEFTFEVRQTRQ